MKITDLSTPVFGGGKSGGGGSSSFPTIVTDSGSSLPATTGFSYNDTFINTTDKKLYTLNSPSKYAVNTSGFDFLNIGATFNDTTGTFSGFSSGMVSIVPKNTTSFTLDIPFQVGNLGSKMNIVQFNYQSPAPLFNVRISSEGNVEAKISGNTYSSISSIQANGKYVLKIEVTGNSDTTTKNVVAKLYDENNNQLGDAVNSSYNSASISIGVGALSDYGPNIQIFNGTVFGFMGENSFNVSGVNVIISAYDWDSGVALTEGQYLDTTNSKLLFYKDNTLTEVVDLSGYKLKAETVTLSGTFANIDVKGNKNYVCSEPVTTVLIHSCETSFEETTIEFTTASSGYVSFDDIASVTWIDFDPSTYVMKNNKSYLIVIFNKLGFVKEY